MIKAYELTEPNSCLSKAGDNEMLFVLRAKDPTAAETIRDWVERRIAAGLNAREDDKIQEALRCAATMEGFNRPQLWSEECNS
jgi:hypothetical protein